MTNETMELVETISLTLCLIENDDPSDRDLYRDDARTVLHDLKVNGYAVVTAPELEELRRRAINAETYERLMGDNER